MRRTPQHRLRPPLGLWARALVGVLVSLTAVGVPAAIAGAEARIQPSQVPVDTRFGLDLILTEGCDPHGGTTAIAVVLPSTFLGAEPTGPSDWQGGVANSGQARVVEWAAPAPAPGPEVVVSLDVLVSGEVPQGTSLPLLVSQQCADGTVVDYNAITDEEVSDSRQRAPEVAAAAALPDAQSEGGLSRGSVSLSTVFFALLGVTVVVGLSLFILRSLLEE